MLYKRTIAYTLSAALASGALAGPLPELGSAANQVLSQKQAQQIGSMLVSQINKQNMLLHDPLAEGYLKGISEKVADPIRQSGKRTQTFIMLDPSINAMALPGGYIGINTGLILATKNESQLAAVIAHETAHVMQNHISRRIAASKAQKLPMLAGLVAALGLGLGGSGSGATGAIMAGMAGNAEAALAFTQGEEQEADDVGLRSMYAAGYNPDGMVQFLQILQHSNLEYMDSNAIGFSTHPRLSTRISEAENRIKALNKQSHPNSLQYALFKARIKSKATSTKHLRAPKQPTKNATAAARYYYALRLANIRKWPQALNQAQQLQADYPNQWWFDILAARCAIGVGKQKLATAIYRNILNLHPDNSAIVMSAVDGYLAMGKAEMAIQLINQTIMYYPDVPSLYQSLARAQSKNGQTTAATLSLAKAALLASQPSYAAALLSGINQRQLKGYLRIQYKALRERTKQQLALVSQLRQNKPPL